MSDLAGDPAPTWQRAAMTALFAYELVALWSRRLPTVTRIVHLHPWLSAPVVGALSFHFHPEEPRRVP